MQKPAQSKGDMLNVATKCESVRVSNGDRLNVECIAVAQCECTTVAQC